VFWISLRALRPLAGWEGWRTASVTLSTRSNNGPRAFMLVLGFVAIAAVSFAAGWFVGTARWRLRRCRSYSGCWSVPASRR
jgi:hypothetical protein